MRERARLDGGPGSGNWGHKGRPGEIGGSAEGGGKHNRQKDKEGKPTSFSKQRREAAKVHALTKDDVKNYLRKDGVVVVCEGKHYDMDRASGMYKCRETGEKKWFDEGVEARLIIPDRMNPNYEVSKQDREAIKAASGKFDSAFYAKTKQEADERDRKRTGKIWKGLDTETKQALTDYTGEDFEPVNMYIRKGDDYVKRVQTYQGEELDTESINRHVDLITDAINKSVLPEDRVFRRGIDAGSAERMFGIPTGYLSGSSGGASVVGRVGTDDAFMSCGSSKDSGERRRVSLEILAPKGTRAMYVEPFSKIGMGQGERWNGEDSSPMISDDAETILQRGTTLQIIGHTVNEDGTHTLRAVVVRQDPYSSEYSKRRKTA